MAIDGTYKIFAESPMGKTEATLHFKTDGDVLTGTNEVMGQTLQIENGKVSGNSFQFFEKMESPMGTTEFRFEGTVEGDKITGTIYSSMGPIKFEGTRVG
ncbi:MAG: hypothetical protein GX357_00735 [Firmicutes bacterium]|nr:hypothetical protein [Bacillota bacterium]